MKSRAAVLLPVLGLAAAAIFVALRAEKETPPPQEVANRVAHEVMSPFCPGVTLHDCPSATADELRAEIVTWARAGATEAEIVARLSREYGEGTIRATPPSGGPWVIAWVVPAAAVACGALVAWWAARRWSASRHDAETPAVVASPEDRARLESDLIALRGEH